MRTDQENLADAGRRSSICREIFLFGQGSILVNSAMTEIMRDDSFFFLRSAMQKTDFLVFRLQAFAACEAVLYICAVTVRI
jgi:hypothetical protein